MLSFSYSLFLYSKIDFKCLKLLQLKARLHCSSYFCLCLICYYLQALGSRRLRIRNCSHNSWPWRGTFWGHSHRASKQISRPSITRVTRVSWEISSKRSTRTIGRTSLAATRIRGSSITTRWWKRNLKHSRELPGTRRFPTGLLRMYKIWKLPQTRRRASYLAIHH